jgi:hypothetical protein
MRIAYSFAVIAFPLSSRLPADLACTEGLLLCDSDALANRFIPTTVYIQAQTAELLLHLPDFKLGSACRFEFGDKRFQVLA